MKFRSFQSQSRTSSATVQKVLGRSDPIVIRDRARILESGSLTVMTENSGDRADLDAILDVGNPMLLQFPPSNDERDRWIAHTEHERSRIIDSSWAHERDEVIPWQEVESPSAEDTTETEGDFILIGAP